MKLGCLRAFALLLLLAAPATAAERMNLLFITVDDMNCDSVGAFGCELEGITPNIDRLASEGMAFDRGFVNIAICQPTRAVWMTGRYPHRNGALGFDPINADVPTLPEALQEAGYYNALIGKTNHVVPTRADSFDLKVNQRDLGHGRSESHYVEAVQRAMAEAKEASKPWFIMANLHDPHRPFAGSKQEKYRPRPAVTRTITPQQAEVPAFLPDLPPVRREMAEYFTSVHRADDIVGAILDELKQAGLADRTVVLFMSDHGMPLPFAKTNCYYHSNHTPWIVRWPGVTTPGSRDAEHFVSGVDVAPTLLAAAGLENLPDTDGSSIVPLLEGRQQPERNGVFTMINTTSGKNAYTMRGVQDGQYLYIWNGWADGHTRFRNESQSGRSMRAMVAAAKNNPDIAARVQHFLYRTTEEMYDLENDPDCLVNLIAEPNDQYTPRATAMSKRLWHWMRDTNDPAREQFEQQVELALD
ncbi:sulfatase [Aeoliella sp. ICT_H6.2]|uniref:Sulfatase n=1 Tax=Aeoliella straminimaris TaxID=2954799 RepID=A0A9X2JEU1_9BACT|nr:sulfatase [Aeoliella straminimaris]MCO6043360.1 sulfatase [Aeoliella straminimaris]